MKHYKVHKGVEAPLKIWGMKQSYFYLYAAVSAFVIALSFGLVMASVQGDFNLGRIFVIIIVAFVILVGLRLVLISKSGKKSYKDTPTTKTLTNIDITKLSPKRR